MVFRQIGRLIDSLSSRDSIETGRSVPARLMTLLSFPFRFLFSFIGFLLTSWASSRPGYAFVRGLPALLAAAGFISALVLAYFLLETRLQGQYESRYVLELTENNDADMAANFAEKLIGFRPDNYEYHYRLGVALYEGGDADGAFDVMRYIAEDPDTPSAPAQVWLARTTIDDVTLDMSDEERDEFAKRYFESAVKNLSPENQLLPYVEAHLGLAQVYQKNGEVDKAIASLRAVLDKEIVIGGQLAAIPMIIKLYQDKGEIGKARAYLRFALDKVGPLSRRMPDNIGIWSVLVSSCVMLNDFESAESVIEEGFQLASNPETRNNIIRLRSEVLIKKADFITDISRFDPFKMRLEAISLAIVANPRSRTAYQRLLDYVVPEENDQEHDQWLRRSIIGSKTPGVMHVILGLRELSSGYIAEGQKHWVIADKQLPQAQLIINNLIEVAFTDAPEKVPNLQDIISVAIENFPDQPAFYATRGQMYMKDKKYNRAIADFEVAVKQLPNTLMLREQMYEAYTQVGNTEKADDNLVEVRRLKAILDELRTQRMDEQQ